MPIDYSKYPANWKTWIRPQILERADDHCEWCDVENRDWGYRKAGVFVPIRTETESEGIAVIVDLEADGIKPFFIVLTIAHLDHDLSNNDGMAAGGEALALDAANLVALCQKCHLGHDAPQRAEKRRSNPNQLDLKL